MANAAKVRWIEATKAWRSDVGARSPETGRRRPVYFRDLPNTAKGRRAAEDRLEAFLRERDRAEALDASAHRDPAVWQVVELYLQHSERTVEPRTVAAHAERLNVWQRHAPGAYRAALPEGETSPGPWTDPRAARSLRAVDLTRVVRAMTAAGHSPNYVLGVIRSAKACWAWAARHDEERQPPRLIPEDVFKDVKGPRLPAAPERYYPPGLAAQLLDWIDARAADAPGDSGAMDRLTALLYRTLYESGARPDEICRATWADLDAAAGCIVYHRHKTSGKTGRARIVPLTADLLARILAARDRPGAHPVYIFTHRRGRGAEKRGADAARAGEPWTVGALGQRFLKLRRACAAATGLDIRVRDGTGHVPEKNPECTLYDFRRSFSTDSSSAGHADEAIAKAQGNSPEMQRRIYQTRHAADSVRLAEDVAARRRGAGSGGE